MKIEVSFVCSPIINFSMQQNHVPVVREIAIKNTTDVTIENLTLSISFEPEFAKIWETNIESIAQDTIITLDAIPIIVSTKFLSELTERILGSIQLRIMQDEEVLFTHNYEISILAFDQWGGSLVLPEILSAFVTPNHPALPPILKRASVILERWTGSPSLDEYQTRDPNRVKKQMAAIYEAISEQGIAYSSAPASFEEYGQRVRLYDTIFKNKLANCLDMALVYAGCLEATGIHPLLIVVKGHAFAGGWLINDSFADSINDDVSQLTKRTAAGINEIVLVETTCMNSGTSLSFDDATSSAEYKLNDTDNFQFFIDIKRSRFAGIRPLPLKITTEEGIQIITDEPVKERPNIAPTLFSTTHTIMDVDKVEVDKQRIWERRLLDLSLRNSLLNIRITKSTLQLISIPINELEDALADGAEFQILAKPKDWDNPLLNTGIYQSLHASDPILDLVEQELTQKRLHCYLPEIDLQKSLTHLYRLSRLSMEENGANTLYLALGLLKWFETPTSTRPRYAPLLLLPIEIIRKSALKGYVIRSRDEDTMMNITLLEMLRQDFGIYIGGLETLPRDESGIDISKAFNTIRRSIMTLTRWDVEEQAIIGNFSFNKFIMWNDIHNNADKLRENKIVASLMSGRVEWDVEEDVNSCEDLDNKISVGEVALPISADSSQLEAISAAVNNKSFILHGPPGTGKSQTITNIIANALYNGKKVLFVAEKMAALSVVQKRLEAIGLAPFCLELHSNKAKKSIIFEQLKRTTEVIKCKTTEEYSFEAEQINILRQDLNNYVKALHTPHAAGLSLYDSFSGYASLSAVSNLMTFDPELMETLTPTKLREFDNAVETYEAACKIIHTPHKHALKEIELTSFSLTIKSNAQQMLSELSGIIKNYESDLNGFLDILEYHPDIISKNRFDSLIHIAKILHETTVLPHELIRADNPSLFADEIASVSIHGEKRDELRDHILKYFDKQILNIDVDSYREQWIELSQWYQQQPDKQASLLPADIHLGSQELLNELLQTHKEYKNEICVLLEIIGCQQCRIDKKSLFEALLGIASTLINATALPVGLIKANNQSETIELIKELISHGIRRDKMRTAILTDFDKSILTANAGLWKRQWLLESGKWLLPKYMGQKKILKQVKLYVQPGYQPETDTITEVFDKIITYQEEQQFIDTKSTDIDSLIGSLWNNSECDWSKLEKAAETLVSLNKYFVQFTQDVALAKLARIALASHLSDGFATFKDLYSDTLSHITDRNDTLHTLFCTVKYKLKAINTAADPVNELLDEIAAYQAEQRYIGSRTATLEPVLGALWNNGECNWEQLKVALDTLSELNHSLASFISETTQLKQTKHAIAARFENGITVFKNINENKLYRFINDYESICQKFNEIETVLKISSSLSKESDWLNTLLNKIQVWSTHIDNLRDWVTYNIQKKQLYELDLHAVLHATENGDLPASEIVNSYKKGLYRSYAEYILTLEPQLNTFNGKLFEEKINKFRSMCKLFEKLTKEELFARLASDLPSLQKEASQSSVVGILQRNIRNGGRGMSIRKLFDTIPELLVRMCPCMLMSPISVAQYIDAGNIKFDLIVFDEASQMPTCEAAGAIARGKNVVVVGDPKQMPPTNFFNSSTIDEDNMEKEDLESILDDCLALTMPSKHLLWHYRSKHESLIAFSNAKYYNNSLLTFPSPDDIATKVTIQFVNGYYDRGKTRQNEEEAKAIISEIKRRLMDEELARFSIGVVTFNTNQQSLIEDLLNELFQSNPQLEAKALECEEPIFIKNLENVQGDERDIILFSVGYGPDKENKVTLNFGPLNRDGGWRRLNVAVSRARYEMKVYSTLRADQIDLNRTSAEGVAGLRAFLEYAEKGKTVLPTNKTIGTKSDDALVNTVAGTLRSKGYAIQTNIGCSGYRIDIGVVDPEEPTKYILGILCDGYNYNTAKTARDREINQTGVLKTLGWRLHHLWSMDWWENPEKTIHALVAAIEEAIASKCTESDICHAETTLPVNNQLIANNSSVERKESVKKNTYEFDDPNAKLYHTTILHSMNIPSEKLIRGLYISDTISRIQKVIEQEAPISKSLLYRKVITSYGITRIGARITAYIDHVLATIKQPYTNTGEEIFYWSGDQTPTEYIQYRPVSEREALDICPEEVSNAIHTILHEQISLSKEDLIRETAHIFGYGRIGDSVATSMSRGIAKADERGFSTNENDRIKVHADPCALTS